jgi:hypothetical protein
MNKRLLLVQLELHAQTKMEENAKQSLTNI